MALQVRIESIERDIQLLLDDTLSPQAKSAALAKFAEQEIDAAQQRNAKVLGRVPTYTQTVDGRIGAPLKDVRPNGIIVAEFQIVSEMLIWIDQQLRKHSPVRTGRYQKSHILLLDGTEDEPTTLAPFDEAAFVNTQPYARKIERGLSSQSPQGVYEAVATLARGRWGNQARITFSFRSVRGGAISDWAAITSLRKTGPGAIRDPRRRAEWLQRQPAIIIRLKD